MHPSIAFALALTLGQISAAGQTSSRDYAGTWTAELAGTTYVRLEISATGDGLRGGLSLGNIQIDAKGLVTKAQAAPRDLTPVQDVVVRETHVSFSRRDVSEMDRFELRLAGADAVDLLFLPSDADRQELEASGLAAPKPIRLKKVGPGGH